MQSKLISVIVPVYNTRPYLSRCIESIMGQTYENLEIILVDDGSTDGSGEVCHKFEQQDSRICVLKQENRGNTAARKRGLAAASGEYIMFVDSDDWIDCELVRVLYEQMEKNQADMVVSNVKIISLDGKETERKSFIASGIYSSSKAAVKDYFYNGKCTGIVPYLVAKLYKKDLVLNATMQIEDRIQFAEDIAVIWTCFMQDIRVAFMKDVRYFYCRRQEGLVESKDEFFLAKINYLYVYLSHLFKNEDFSLLRQLDKFMVSHVRIGINWKLGLAQKDLLWEKYCFDFSRLYTDVKRVVIYGAGKVGQECYKQLRMNKNIHICAWVDKDSKNLSKLGLEVQHLDILRQLEYDCIIIAVKHEAVFMDIMETLDRFSIDKKKIIWGKPLEEEDDLL